MQHIGTNDGQFHGESAPGAGDATALTPEWFNEVQRAVDALEESSSGSSGGTAGPDALRTVTMAAGQTVTIDPVATPAVALTLNGAGTLAISWPAAADGSSVRFSLAISDPSGYGITWPANCLWSGAAKPVLATTGKNHFHGRSFDNGATWLMSYELALRDSPVMAKPDLPYDPYWDTTTLVLQVVGLQGSTVIQDDRHFYEPVFTDNGLGSSLLPAAYFTANYAGWPLQRKKAHLNCAGDMAGDGTGLGDIWKYGLLDSAAIADFGAGDFTIECWYASTNMVAHNQVLLDRWLSNVGWQVGVYNGKPSIKINATRYSGPTAIFDTGLVSHHLAFVRRSGVLAIFVDGVMVFSVANTVSLSSTTLPLVLGGTVTAKSSPFCFVTDIRINKLARYTDPFTPPASLPTMGLV